MALRFSHWLGLSCVLLLLLCWGGAGSAQAEKSPRLRWSSLQWQKNLAQADDTQGKRHSLTLQASLQEPTQLLLQRARPLAGAVVLLDVPSGAVLAAAEIGKTEGGSLLFEPLAPAASVFKLVTTIALYERSDLTPRTRVCTRGGLRSIHEEHLHAASGPGSLCSPFSQALGVSRNAAYAQLATQKLLRNDLLEIAESLGFNRALPLETPGRVGKLEVPYNDLEFARTATGFENSQLSVFGGAQLAYIIAAGGYLRPMHLVQPEDSAAPSPPGERVMSARSVERLTRAMEITVQSGTAREAFWDERGRSQIGPIQVAGKTGTLKPHAQAPTASWFVGFAPSQKPRVVVSVLLQNPDLWHQKGHQLARDILRVYFAQAGFRGVTSPLDPHP